MRLRNGSSRISDVFDLEGGKPDFLACVAPLVEVTNGYLPSSRIYVNRGLTDVFCIALDGGHLGKAGAKRQFRMRDGRAAYSAQCARVPCLRMAGWQFAQEFRDIVGCEKVVRKREGLERLVDCRLADSHVFKLFVARRVETM